MPNLSVVEPHAPSALEQLVEDYLASCRARGLAPRTVSEAYGYPLRRVFLPFCAEREITAPGQISRRVLDALSSHLLKEGGPRGKLSLFTVHSYLTAINAFLSWAGREGDVGEGVKA